MFRLAELGFRYVWGAYYSYFEVNSARIFWQTSAKWIRNIRNEKLRKIFQYISGRLSRISRRTPTYECYWSELFPIKSWSSLKRLLRTTLPSIFTLAFFVGVTRWRPYFCHNSWLMVSFSVVIIYRQLTNAFMSSWEMRLPRCSFLVQLIFSLSYKVATNILINWCKIFYFCANNSANGYFFTLSHLHRRLISKWILQPMKPWGIEWWIAWQFLQTKSRTNLSEPLIVEAQISSRIIDD